MVHDEVLKQVEGDELAVYAVWMPVLASDNAKAGLEAEKFLPDSRVTHYWDGDNRLGRLYGSELTLPRGRQLAWDIYFVYAPEVEWGDRLPMPTEWVHQLGLDERHLGDGARLRAQILEMISREPGRDRR